MHIVQLESFNPRLRARRAVLDAVEPMSGVGNPLLIMHSERYHLIVRLVVRVALWSKGYFRVFGRSEQIVNALLRRFSVERFKTVPLADRKPKKYNA